jgi:hypothetical protein
MVRMKRTLLGLLLMLLLVGGGTQVVAQSARPEGRVALESTSIAAGVGVDWGMARSGLMGRIISFQCPASAWATGESRRSMQWAMSIIWLDLQTLRAPMWPDKPGSQWLGGSMP